MSVSNNANGERLIFFSLTIIEYVAHDIIATSIHKSPLFKLRLSNLLISNLVIIIRTPNKEVATPVICVNLILSFVKQDEKKIIKTGIVDIIKTPLRTCVKLRE